jgi:hypothetical protein
VLNRELVPAVQRDGSTIATPPAPTNPLTVEGMDDHMTLTHTQQAAAPVADLQAKTGIPAD